MFIEIISMSIVVLAFAAGHVSGAFMERQRAALQLAKEAKEADMARMMELEKREEYLLDLVHNHVH